MTQARGQTGAAESKDLRDLLRDFHGDGFFQWQFSDKEHKKRWEDWHYDEEKYWGDSRASRLTL